jgi:hypothetical protein
MYTVIIILVLSCLVFTVSLYSKRKGGTVLDRQGPALATILQDYNAQQTDTGMRVVQDGVSYGYRYISGGEGPSFIRLSREIKPSWVSGAALELPTMMLRQERDRDRFGKSIHLNKELQTGDPLFDARVYIECDSRGSAAARMLKNPEVRKGVTGLLALGFKQLYFRKHGHAMVVTWQIGPKSLTKDLLDEAMRRMTQIVDGLPPFRRVPTKTQHSAGTRLVLFYMAMTCIVVLGMMYVLAEWSPLGNGLQPMILNLSLCLFAAQALVTWLVVKGSSSALRAMIQGNLISLAMAPMLCTALIIGANGIGDTEVIYYSRALDHKRISESDDSKTHYLYFASIQGVKGSSFSIKVSSTEYHQARVGDMYDLTVGAGNLGTPWLRQLVRQP